MKHGQLCTPHTEIHSIQIEFTLKIVKHLEKIHEHIFGYGRKNFLNRTKFADYKGQNSYIQLQLNYKLQLIKINHKEMKLINHKKEEVVVITIKATILENTFQFK